MIAYIWRIRMTASMYVVVFNADHLKTEPHQPLQTLQCHVLKRRPVPKHSVTEDVRQHTLN